MRQRAGLQIRIDLFNDRTLSMNLIGRDGVQVTGGEHRMKPAQIKQTRLIDILFVQLRDAAHHQAAGNLLGLLLRAERGKRYLGDSSTIASGY